MSDFITTLSDVNTLFETLKHPLLEEKLSKFGYKSDLQGLNNTIKSLHNILVDAGAKNCQTALTEPSQDYIQKLKDALYDADDLFDKLVTLGKRRNCNRSKKVCHLISSKNPLIAAWSVSRDVEKIRNRFSVDTPPSSRQVRVRTHPYVHADDVIRREDGVVGREDDVREVVGRLLNPTNDVGFLAIVSMGGLGKTTLARLVYDNDTIVSEFPVRAWTCVADHGGKLDVIGILSQILEAVGFESVDRSSIEYVQGEYERNIRGKKLLLVLDDVWTKNPVEWQELREFLLMAGKGSRILATTRSMETANIIGNDAYELQALSEENSLHLFNRLGF